MAHWSSCDIHNGPALPVGPCNCGNDAPEDSNVIQFLPRSNPKADRAFWKGPSPIEVMAAEILKDDAFKFEDTAPSEYWAPDGDCA